MKTKLIILMILITTIIRGQDCVLVHGWLNNGAVWNGSGVKNVVDNEYHFNRILQPTLGGTYSAATQSLNLRDYLINNNVQNSLTISYSMGGMNTRYHLKRQFEQSQPGRIDHHFTIGTPHIGALIANNRTEAINRILLGCEAALFPTGYLGEVIFGEIIIYYSILDFAYFAGSIIGTSYIDAILNNTGGPALTDLEMGSPADIYINHPNTNYENNVIKVGIAGVEDYPQLYRLASSTFGFTEEQMLDIENYIKAYKLIFLIFDFINFVEQPTPTNLAYLEESLGMYSIFDKLAKTYNKLVSDSESGDSDGIVQKNSQIYPNFNRQYYSNGANHIEELDHIEVLARLRQALNFYGFGPQLPPIISHFTQNPSPICKGSSGYVYAYLSQGNGNLTYTWDDEGSLTNGAYIQTFGPTIQLL